MGSSPWSTGPMSSRISGGVNISSIFSLLMLRCYRHPVCTENSIRRRRSKRTALARILMTDLFRLILGILASRFKARATLEAENLVLRQQVNVLRRRTPKRPHLNNTDRFLFVWLYRWFPSVLEVVAIVRPETVIRWHRAGFRAYWRWRSRNRVGRPKVSAELRTLIGEMSRANALWGAPRIHGELLKLGFEVAQSTVARYMCRHSRPPSQGWRTFLGNHADGIAAIDLFVLPTIAFQVLYCLVIVRHGRRLWVSFGVTANPTAEWISGQVTEAFPWDHAPRYLIRDRDTSYGPVFLQRIRAMGIRDHPIAPRSDRKSTRLNSSHDQISYAVFCLKKKKRTNHDSYVSKKKKKKKNNK